MMYFYEPEDKDAKPFCVEWDGGEFIAQSPHKYHKRVQQEYVVEEFFDKHTGKPIIDTKTGQPMKLLGKRTVWVLDEEKNQRLEKGEIGAPFNAVDIPKKAWRDLQTNKHRPQIKQLVSQEQKFKEERKTMQEMKKQYDSYEMDKVALEEERVALRAMREDLRKQREKIEKDAMRK